MKFTYSWLLDHLDTKFSAAEIGETLTSIGLELETLTDYNLTHSQFIVATIEEFKKHPNADRLNLCIVNDGKKTYQVVCGATNVKKGLKGIFARDGLFIPGTNITLKKGKIRGEVSEGMLLSERELGLSDDHEGIIELKTNFPNGTDAVTALSLNDPIFEIGLTPNRGDCLGIRGIARDLAAKGIGKLKSLNFEKIKKMEFESPINWTLEKDDNSCEYVVSRYFKDVKNITSPDWLKKKLTSIGLRPINALVDITNFITMDIGRPLHVFDADKIGNILSMRVSQESETIFALDNKDYKLNKNTTVIADDKKPLAIAGIIGGSDSGCTIDTKNVFLEVAVFDPSKVAKTGRKLGIHSDARQRFERGLDKKMVEEGLEYASFLIQSICGGYVSKNTDAGELIDRKVSIKYEYKLINKKIGFDISSKEQIGILKNLQFQISQLNENDCTLEVPSWRNDINTPIDIVEEVIRIYGYDHIPSNIPLPSIEEINNIEKSIVNKKHKIIKKIKKLMISQNFSEIITFSFHSNLAHQLGQGDPSLKVTNSISDEYSYMRNSMLFNHLEVIESNRKKGINNLNTFEIGPIYQSSSSQENTLLAVKVNIVDQNTIFKKDNVDFYSLSSTLSNILTNLNFDIMQFNISRCNSPLFHPGQSAELFMGKKIIARYGKIHPSVLNEYTKLNNIFGFELFYENLPIDSILNKRASKTFESNFQYSEKDFSFIFEKNQNLFEVYRVLLSIDKNLIKNIEFFDQYSSEEIGEDMKSVTFKVTLQSMEKTLDEKDLDNIHNIIIEKVTSKFNAKLRS
jgi:phenylalanyl-tRNA synthetase beta chain